MEANTYLVADLFCGAGGSSTGAQKAIEEIGGTMELVAVNHWNTAIATHSANHPTARHLVEDVSMVDPEAVVEEGRLDILMASPECKYHSRARGGKPIHDQGRMNPWAVHNWLTKLDVTCVLVENVPEFVDWGPLGPDGRPIKSKKGEYFQPWFLTFLGLGYTAEWRMLNAADYGEATTRTRFFLLARKDGQPVTWPEPSHAKGDTGMFPGRLPWRGAREIIDWTNAGRSLLDDPKYRKKPLAEKTRQRIARGLQKFGGPLAPLYIRLLDLPGEEADAAPQASEGGSGPFILNRHGENGSLRVHSVDEPMPTATTRGAGYLVDTKAEPFHGSDRQHTLPRSIDEPVHTITTLTGGGNYVVQLVAEPLAEPLVDTKLQPFLLGQQSGGAPRSTEEPAPTVTGNGAISLLQGAILEYYGNSDARDIGKPLPAITSMNKHALYQPCIIEYYGHSDAADVNEPLPTLTAKARHGLANPTLVEVNHGNKGVDGDNRRTRSVDEPLGSLTSKRGVGLVQAVLVQTSQTGDNGSYAPSTEEPLPTLTSHNETEIATPMPKPYLVPNFGERDGQEPRVHDIDEPVPAVTSRGAGSLVSPMLVEPVLKEVRDADIDPRRLVFVDGHPYLLDITFRMLQNPELARAMGFEDEETSYEFVGNVAEITKQIGNAVPVRLAAALVREALRPGVMDTDLARETLGDVLEIAEGG